MLSVVDLCHTEDDDDASVTQSTAMTLSSAEEDDTMSVDSRKSSKRLDSAEEDDDMDEDSERDEGWSDHNRWYCNICKVTSCPLTLYMTRRSRAKRLIGCAFLCS